MTREDIVQSRDYIFAREACRYGIGQDVMQAFEDGAEFGYKFAVEKACEWLRRTQPSEILPDTTIERFKKTMEE